MILATSWLLCMMKNDKVSYCYRMAKHFSGIKLWQIDGFMSFGQENVGEFTIAKMSYFNESGIWLGGVLQLKFVLPKFSPAIILRYSCMHD